MKQKKQSYKGFIKELDDYVNYNFYMREYWFVYYWGLVPLEIKREIRKNKDVHAFQSILRFLRGVYENVWDDTSKNPIKRPCPKNWEECKTKEQKKAFIKESDRIKRCLR